MLVQWIACAVHDAGQMCCRYVLISTFSVIEIISVTDLGQAVV